MTKTKPSKPKCRSCEALQLALKEEESKLAVLEDLLKSEIRSQAKQLKALNDKITERDQRIEELEKELKAAKAKPFKRKSEKQQKPENKRPPLTEEEREALKKKRVEGRKRRAEAKKKAKEKLPVKSEEVIQPATDNCVCPLCGDTEFRDLPSSREIEIIDTEIEELHLRKIKLQKKGCSCGDKFVEAKFQERALPGCEYGPNLIAKILVSKVLLAVPFYRQEQQFDRLGFRIPNSTLCNLFHEAAKVFKPVYNRLKDLLNQGYIVHADETTITYLAHCDDPHGRITERGSFTGYFWALLEPEAGIVCFHFDPSRGKAVATELITEFKDTEARILVCDQYDGYNDCTGESTKRTRVGCHAHARRKFKELESDYPEIVKPILEHYSTVYEVEAKARELGLDGSAEHLLLRTTASAEALENIKAACSQYVRTDEKGNKELLEGCPFTADCPLINAMAYFLRHNKNLTEFLKDARIPVDNNAVERLIRPVALLRKNSLFVKKPDSAQNTAILLSLALTCELAGVNALAYFADVMVKLTNGNFTEHNCDELLPQNWKVPKRPPKLAQS